MANHSVFSPSTFKQVISVVSFDPRPKTLIIKSARNSSSNLGTWGVNLKRTNLLTNTQSIKYDVTDHFSQCFKIKPSFLKTILTLGLTLKFGVALKGTSV